MKAELIRMWKGAVMTCLQACAETCVELLGGHQEKLGIASI